MQEEEEAVNSLMIQEKKKPHSSPTIEMKVKIDDCLVKMEVDTGAIVSLMSQKTFRQLWPRRTLKSTEVRLLGMLKDFQAKIHIDPHAKPRFFKARTVPYACCWILLCKFVRIKDQTAINTSS